MQPGNEATIDKAVARAVQWLEESQLPSGEFSTLLAPNPNLEGGIHDASPFVTSHVLHSLHELESPRIQKMAAKGLRFLAQEKAFGGVWRYYSPLQWKHLRIPPDLDDTACASHAFGLFGKSHPNNQWVFLENRNKEGQFLTWIVPRRTTPRQILLRFLLKTHDCFVRSNVPPRPGKFENLERFQLETDQVPIDDIDPVVNANVLLYLGFSEATRPVITLLEEQLKDESLSSFSHYYTNPLSLYYALVRASRQEGGETISSLVDRARELTEMFLKSEHYDGGALSTALALNILSNRRQSTSSTEQLVATLLEQQKENGSWKGEAFYSGPTEFWGSAELTTGFSIEALHRYGRPTSR